MKRRKAIRMEQIAEEVGVSTVTVSNAFRRKKGVSEKLRNKILETAEAMGYPIPEEAVKNGRSFTIGIAVAERYIKEFPSFYMDIYRCMAQELTKHGSMSIFEIIHSEQEKMANGFHMFQGAEIEGVILIGEMKPEYVKKTAEVYKSIPVIGIDFYSVFPELDYVVTDSYGGMQQMTELLLDAGYRDLMFVGTPSATGSIMDRYMGFRSALEKWSVAPREDHILYDRGTEEHEYNISIQLPEKLPEAFVCNCDKSANLLIEKLLSKKVRIPEDVSIVSFDHYYSQVHNGIKLTTYENDENALARTGTGIMMKRLKGNETDVGIHIIRGKIVYGNTVGKSKENREEEGTAR